MLSVTLLLKLVHSTRISSKVIGYLTVRVFPIGNKSSRGPVGVLSPRILLTAIICFYNMTEKRRLPCCGRMLVSPFLAQCWLLGFFILGGRGILSACFRKLTTG
jgi:hypothetical protein